MITICIFAKPPVAGQVKTRLAATIGAEAAARLAAAFLADTWTAVCGLPWARGIVASTGPLASGLVPEASVWPQGEGPLDARLERVLQRALVDGDGAIALGADSPGLPLALLEAARRCLEEATAVIGPADDGGFYLLGVPRFPPGLLAQVPWSAADTCAATVARMTARGLPPTRLPGWFDVDDARDLERLRELLGREPGRAPCTSAVLEAM